ncbi:hypothetical protein ACWGCW_00710 [Streptomyces sp. NPDC054933]
MSSVKTALGPELAAYLTTSDQRAVAAEVFALIAEDSDPGAARAWLIGVNPHLDDENPIRAIAANRADEVLAAAHAYADGQNAA